MKRFLLPILSLLLSASSAQAADRPNIIVIFTDDQGFADLGVQGIRDDIRTPHIDRLADRGVRMTHGFVTAPQCMPSRVGLLTGRYQQRSGVEGNTTGKMHENAPTIASELKKLGYVTGMSGKWGVGGGPNWKDIKADSRVVRKGDLAMLPAARGFDEYFSGVSTLYAASHDLKGQPITDAPQIARDDGYRVEVQARAAVQFIERHAESARPFFLYYAPYSPHSPFTAPQRYLDQFASVRDEKRQTCLAMMACVDDSVGSIVAALKEHKVLDNTIIWYISDNGAPSNGGGLNQPLNGWKGQLLDGGVRVPFIVSWPSKLAGGHQYSEMVSTLDLLPTCLAVAGREKQPTDLDGVNLLPFLTGIQDGAPHDALFFRWMGRAALRTDQWKLLLQRGEVSLFNLKNDPSESKDLSEQEPAICDQLKARLQSWLTALPKVKSPPDANPRRRPRKQHDDSETAPL